MKNILVPTDFSVAAMKAATYAMEIAKRADASVYLMHVIEPIIDNIRQPHALHERLEEEILNSRLNQLKNIQANLRECNPDIKIETELAHGTVTTSLVSFAEKHQVDLIVMGTTGASGLKEIFIGSVAAGTVGRTKVPVLAVPFEYPMEEPDAIVFTTNRFEEDRQLLDPIIELARLFSATVHTVVFIDSDYSDADYYIHNHRELNKYIKFLKETYTDVSIIGDFLEGKEFEDTIEQYHKNNEADIVAMITYPKSFWEKLMRKSRTKKMAFHTKIPLLAVPSK